MQTILVTITGPGKSMDLEVPGEIALYELLPELVQLCGSSSSGEVTGESLSWILRLPTGGMLDARRSLIESEIMDGAVLVLQDSQAPARERAPARQFQPPPVTPSRETGGIGIHWNKEGLIKDN
jgi:hypothetical protein